MSDSSSMVSLVNLWLGLSSGARALAGSEVEIATMATNATVIPGVSEEPVPVMGQLLGSGWDGGPGARLDGGQVPCTGHGVGQVGNFVVVGL